MIGSQDKFCIDGKPGRTAYVDGQEYQFFSGYNYLGVNQDQEFQTLLLEGVEKYGWVFPSSRISNTYISLYEECEAFLAGLTGSEDAVLLSSGFTAGRLATSLYPNIYNAPGSHPAIVRNTSTLGRFEDWSKWFLSKLNKDAQPLAIASDSLSILSAELYDFSFLSEANETVNVVIDDSHGAGLIGNEGKGISTLVPVSDKLKYTFCYSLSKSFGISGGAVSCSKQNAEILRTSPEYTATTPLSPAQVYAFLKGQHIYDRQREKLLNNISFFIKLIKELPDISYAPGFPVFVLPSFVDEFPFYKNHILISSFAYPDPSGIKLKRIVLNALHTKEDLTIVASVLHDTYRKNKEAFRDNIRYKGRNG